MLSDVLSHSDDDLVEERKSTTNDVGMTDSERIEGTGEKCSFHRTEEGEKGGLLHRLSESGALVTSWVSIHLEQTLAQEGVIAVGDMDEVDA